MSIAVKHANGLPAGVFKVLLIPTPKTNPNPEPNPSPSPYPNQVQPLINNASLSFKSVRLPFCHYLYPYPYPSPSP